MIKKITITFFCLPIVAAVSAQKDSTRLSIYRVKPAIELPAAAAGVALSTIGFRQLEKRGSLSPNEVLALDPSTINAFDRPTAFLNPAGFAKADKRSDLFLNIALVSPLLLGLDKEIRKDWVDLLSLYLMTHAADNAIYFAAGFSLSRPRPLAYNQQVPMAEKTGSGISNSFFSGHTSFSSAATFFMAKVYTDYHHIRGWKRVLAYTIASVPPALVGYNRIHAGKHFKTDVIVGFLVGAASGITVPELHRNKKKKHAFTMIPYYTEGMAGVSATVKL